MLALDTRAGLFWLVPVLFAIHNLEEGTLMEGYLPAARAIMPVRLRRLVGRCTYRQFVALLVFVTLVPFLIAVFGNLAIPHSAAGYALLAIQATLLLNVASHVAAAIMLRGYSPGLVTAVLVNLPFSLWLIALAWQEHWYSVPALIALAPLALVLHGPVLLGLLRVAARIPTA